MADPSGSAIALKLAPWLLPLIFWAGVTVTSSKTTGKQSDENVKKLERVINVQSEHKKKIAVLETDVQYIKGGIDDIKRMMRQQMGSSER